MRSYQLALLFGVHSLFAGVTGDVAMTISKEEALAVPGACFIEPPTGWELIDPKQLLPEVKFMIRSKPLESCHLAPSLNLAMEETDFTQEEYVRAVQEMYKDDPSTTWIRLGSIDTSAGSMALTQLELTTEWGRVQMLQAILVKQREAYVITATADKGEFVHFSPAFFKAMGSFTINFTR